ncbi:MAG: flagellar type III secretion system pore protein FliP [Thermodesulfobacteriota bacterium]|nr:flagellar type III secretion system pore protein FliP [Thermodesulfobacteriota bacterium]
MKAGSISRCVLMGFFLLLVPGVLYAAGVSVPSVTLGIEETQDPEKVVGVLQILFILTILALAPSIMIMVTSFTRIIVVLGFLRQAIGTQQMPPQQVLSALAIFLTFFIMTPTINRINEDALTPYRNGYISFDKALEKAQQPLRGFMFKQTREDDLALFMNIIKEDKPKNRDDVPTRALIPAFMISELKTAFQIGFILFLPFLILDMVVASILLSMGMMMLPPIMISLPFKIMLFVLVDGWNPCQGVFMTPETVTAIMSEAIKMALLVGAPMLIVGLVVGLSVSIFSAVTQIQEMTLTFVPKIVLVFIALLVSLPWIMEKLITYTVNLYTSIPMITR